MLSSSRRRVKIVCTLGPSSRTQDQIYSLIHEGMDVARLNFSHGSHDAHKEVIQNVRDAAKRAGKSVAIMQDLQGPKIRVGKLGKGGITLSAGEMILLHPEGKDPTKLVGKATPLPVSAEIAEVVSRDIQPGGRILFDDGKIAARALQVSAPEILAVVEVGGKLTDHKGMNLPGTPLSIPCLTEKDVEDLKFGISQGVDAIALSFVRSAADIKILREKIQEFCTDLSRGSPFDPPIVIAKIEREEAVENQESIIDVVDGLLVARGDMAVELGAERVPIVQKQLISSCNRKGKPIITATQMLESMISSPTPTRAEASDVANAVFDGTDAVMLSGETASGQYPMETVRTMTRIILEAERFKELNVVPFNEHPTMSIVDAIESSAARIADEVDAVAIACLTHSGMAARTLAKYRPRPPVVAIMDNEGMLRRLAFVWGVRGVLIPKIVSTDDLFAMVEKALMANGWAQPEDLVVVTAGVPTLRRGTTNMVKVHRIAAKSERDNPSRER